MANGWLYHDKEKRVPTCFIIWLTKDKVNSDTENRVGGDLLPGVARKREKVTGRNPGIILHLWKNSRIFPSNTVIRQNNTSYVIKTNKNRLIFIEKCALTFIWYMYIPFRYLYSLYLWTYYLLFSIYLEFLQCTSTEKWLKKLNRHAIHILYFYCNTYFIHCILIFFKLFPW